MADQRHRDSRGLPEPLAAFALSADSSLIPLSPSAKGDWATSLVTQLNLFKWLQSAEGGIAGGVTNNWGGPQYHNPPSNQWFGYQTWPMERLAEYYYATGNAEAQSILALSACQERSQTRAGRPARRTHRRRLPTPACTYL